MTLPLPPGVTARQLLAQLSREIAEDDARRREAEMAKADEARLARAERIKAQKAELDAATAEYLRIRQQLLPVLQRLWRTQAELGPHGAMHPHLWRVTLPSLHEKDPNSPMFSTFDIIHHAKGELPPW
jgi:hypothetical protein